MATTSYWIKNQYTDNNAIPYIAFQNEGEELVLPELPKETPIVVFVTKKPQPVQIQPAPTYPIPILSNQEESEYSSQYTSESSGFVSEFSDITDYDPY